MANLGRFVLWILIVVAAAVGIRSAYGVLNATDTEPALKSVSAQCSSPATGLACVDMLARLDRLRASAWLSATATALAGVGLAFGLGLLILAFDAAETRTDRDRRLVASTSLIVITISIAVLVAALVVRSISA